MRITLFYLLSIALILCIVPWNAIVPGHSPFVDAMTVMGIPGAALTIRIVVLSAIVSCLNSSIYITSRTLYGLAVAGEAPAIFGHLSAQGVPARAVTASSLIGLGVAFASIVSPNMLFSFLVGASGAVILFVYFLIARAHKRMRAEMARAGALPVAFRMRFSPWLNDGVMGAILFIVLAMIATPDQRPTAIASIGAMVVTLGIYAIARPRIARGSHGTEVMPNV
jgi:GABA permease